MIGFIIMLILIFIYWILALTEITVIFIISLLISGFYDLPIDNYLTKHFIRYLDKITPVNE